MLKGKIVLVPFPFDELTSSKVRHAICLTNQISSHNQVVVTFIISSIPQELEITDIILDIDDPDYHASGLQVPSTIQLHRMVTISTSIIVRELGTVSTKFVIEIENKLKKLFELNQH